MRIVQRRTRIGVGVVAVGAAVGLTGSVLVGAAGAGAADASNRVAFLLTDSGTAVASYRLDTNTLGAVAPLTGLAGDSKLLGIDYRIQNRKMYGVGDAGGVYVLNNQSLAQKVGQLSVLPSGTAFGVDFNPAANALRIVSDTGQNLRQSFAVPPVATVVDGTLNYTAGTTATGISAAAYTNNDLSTATGTTLFDIDATLNQVVTQAPANNGSLQLTGTLGVDVPADIGFDIYSTLDGSGRSVDNAGFAVVPGDGVSTLHQVSLLTGQASVLAEIPLVVTDLAILPLAATTPAA